MKLRLLLLAFVLATALRVAADPVGITATNELVFPQLLSTNETVLMTNAEFRCTQGIKVFFRSQDGSLYENFDATIIDSNQLAQMGLDLSKMENAQARLAAGREQFAQEEAAGQAALAAAQAQAAAQQQSANASATSDQTQTSTNSASSSYTPEKKPHRRRE